jgi:hypothetical protein
LHDASDLLRAIAALISAVAWPALIFLIILLGRNEIPRVLQRLRRGTFPGGSFDLDPQVDRLVKTVEEARIRLDVQPKPPEADDHSHSIAEGDAERDRIVRLARDNPRLAVKELGDIIEREVRILAGTLGIPGFDRLAIRQLVELLIRRGAIGVSMASSVDVFNATRDRIIHGELVDTGDINTVIDIGLTLLQVIRAVPHETYRVVALLPIYDDATATKQISGVNGVLLDVSSPGAGRIDKRIFPTRRSYSPGTQVSWTWDLSEVIEPAYYRDAESGEVKQAWTSAGLFDGIPLN